MLGQPRNETKSHYCSYVSLGAVLSNGNVKVTFLNLLCIDFKYIHLPPQVCFHAMEPLYGVHGAGRDGVNKLITI